MPTFFFPEIILVAYQHKLFQHKTNHRKKKLTKISVAQDYLLRSEKKNLEVIGETLCLIIKVDSFFHGGINFLRWRLRILRVECEIASNITCNYKYYTRMMLPVITGVIFVKYYQILQVRFARYYSVILETVS